MSSGPTSARAVYRAVEGCLGEEQFDQVVVEEPLSIRVASEAVAVTMRTPGNDRELAAGFLFAEGLIASRDDIGSIFHCGRPGDPDYGNVIELTPGPGARIDPDRISFARRGTLTSSSCGVCGRQSIADLVARCLRVESSIQLSPIEIASLGDRLRDHQPIFQQTGGLHAAAVFDPAGDVLQAFEDVGRHNAVDKVIGKLVLEPGAGRAEILLVSGRVSFEIVQKAVAARIAVVAGVSAPTSLAIDLADRMGVTLVGFVRGTSFNVYTHPTRIVAGC